MARKAAKKRKKAVVKSTKSKTAKKMKKVAKKMGKRKGKVLAVPNGYRSITPYLIINNASEAIDFYKKVFGAKVGMCMEKNDGRIGHAELKIGDAMVMLADEYPEMDARAPAAYGGTPVSIHLYVKNVDKIIDQAVNAGATILRPIENMFYGDRAGTVKDPYGHIWYVSTHVEDVTPAQIRKRAAELFGNKYGDQG